MSTYVCSECRGREECTCDGAKIAEERDELRARVAELEEGQLGAEEAAALLKVLDEVDYVGAEEFARLDLEEEAAFRRALPKLKAMVDGD